MDIRTVEIPLSESPDQVYLRRFTLLSSFVGIKVHHILCSDSELLGLHSHPWHFVSVALAGRYRNVTREQAGKPRRVHFVGRKSFHRVQLEGRHSVTLVATIGRPAGWSFWLNGELIPQEQVVRPEILRGTVSLKEFAKYLARALRPGDSAEYTNVLFGVRH